MILIFGKTGQVARELQHAGDVLALSREFINLSNPSSCYEAIKIHAPTAVINAAAYTNVDKAETEEELAKIKEIFYMNLKQIEPDTDRF